MVMPCCFIETGKHLRLVWITFSYENQNLKDSCHKEPNLFCFLHWRCQRCAQGVHEGSKSSFMKWVLSSKSWCIWGIGGRCESKSKKMDLYGRGAKYQSQHQDTDAHVHVTNMCTYITCNECGLHIVTPHICFCSCMSAKGCFLHLQWLLIHTIYPYLRFCFSVVVFF